MDRFRSRMSAIKPILPFLTLPLLLIGQGTASAQQPDRMVRIAEIEIVPAELENYKAILTEEAAASVRLEPGVICIFPMYRKDSPTSIRLLEIYASRAAYEAHIKSPHFQHYKTATLPMVKSLKLVEMTALDPATMPLLFKKLDDKK
ncbi:quinol monooxygenase YgiN [Spirosoma oryzae]|uniref:Quinol monooxygenase YgiN n=1 Tax=Spirosoma oryzae TaxID=1469603 RepID=A0A2T0SVV4_9BACT|nr:putative quinol monooxygenase [Spirosoma oryzae]PRY37546.1 quinol monooxygenase YgiN [Spirosoma oryzae]